MIIAQRNQNLVECLRKIGSDLDGHILDWWCAGQDIKIHRNRASDKFLIWI